MSKRIDSEHTAWVSLYTLFFSRSKPQPIGLAVSLGVIPWAFLVFIAILTSYFWSVFKTFGARHSSMVRAFAHGDELLD